MSATATLTLRMPQELREKLDRLAERTARSRAGLAVDALSSYLEAQEWQLREIQKGVEEADAGDFASETEVARVFRKWRDAD